MTAQKKTHIILELTTPWARVAIVGKTNITIRDAGKIEEECEFYLTNKLNNRENNKVISKS